MNNQKFDVCYNVQTTIDDKNNLIVDYEVTNDVNDKKQLNEMASRAKEVLEVESPDVYTDKDYVAMPLNLLGRMLGSPQ